MKSIFSKALSIFPYVLLPLAVGVYPVLFLFARNAKLLDFSDITLPLGLAALVAVVGFTFFILVQKRAVTASLSMAVFMVIYYLYGFLVNGLRAWDHLPVRQYIFLPVVVSLGFYAGYFISLIKLDVAAVLQKILMWVSLGLVGVNLVTVAPVEINKLLPAQEPASVAASGPAQKATAGKKYPDIYFILFDEYIGFKGMKGYWHDNSVDQYAAFLAQNHFFMAPDSQSVTYNTLTEMASKLNLHQYSLDTDASVKMTALQNNKVMAILKSYGYTTVSINMAFQGIKADKSVSFASSEVEGMGADEFERTFIQGSMADAFSGLLLDNNVEGVKQEQDINYALAQTTSLPKTTHSPFFVYTHLLLPHEPFIFDKNGNLNPPQDFYDWHYYQGQYEYTTKVMEQLITKLLSQADPANPPVIIIQSDHGARNMQSRTSADIVINGVLQNYPTQNYTMVFNSMYLPGYDTSTLPADIAPIDTFELVLNHYLNAGVTVDTDPTTLYNK